MSALQVQKITRQTVKCSSILWIGRLELRTRPQNCSNNKIQQHSLNQLINKNSINSPFHLCRVDEKEQLAGEETLSDIDQRPDVAPGLRVDHGASEADQDDEDLKNK